MGNKERKEKEERDKGREGEKEERGRTSVNTLTLIISCMLSAVGKFC